MIVFICGTSRIQLSYECHVIRKAFPGLEAEIVPIDESKCALHGHILLTERLIECCFVYESKYVRTTFREHASTLPFTYRGQFLYMMISGNVW